MKDSLKTGRFTGSGKIFIKKLIKIFNAESATKNYYPKLDLAEYGPTKKWCLVTKKNQ